VVVVVGVVDLGADPADHPAVPPRDEELGVGVFEVGVEPRAQGDVPLQLERGNPLGVVSMQPERKLDELPPVATRGDRAYLERHGAAM
jgi:hypothetical protein